MNEICNTNGGNKKLTYFNRKNFVKRSLGKCRSRWEDNTTMDLKYGEEWGELIWLKIGPSGRSLLIR
jgi:hypothetical protein